MEKQLISLDKDRGFIKACYFDGEFYPFPQGEIPFWWAKEVRQLMEFYCKNKNINKDVCKNIKINCIVGNNGAGKSRIFSYISDNLKNDDVCVLLDDFFALWSWFCSKYNVNRYLFAGKSFYSNKSSQDIDSTQNTSYIYNFVLLFNYFLHNKQKWSVDFMYSFFKKSIQKNELCFRSGWDKDYWTHVFRKNFINSDEKYNTLRKVLNMSWENFVEYQNIIEKIINNISNQKYEAEWKDFLKYLNILQKITQRIARIMYRKNVIIWWDIGSLESICSTLVDNARDNFSLNELLNVIIKIDEISDEEKVKFLYILSDKVFYIFDSKFTDEYNKDYYFSQFSAWEQTLFLRILNIVSEIYLSHKDKFIILIDEPDLHLHLWIQKQYIQKLIDTFLLFSFDKKLHFIISTHSPFILSDLPKESIVLLKREDGWTRVIPTRDSTFGANFIDLINNGFFFADEGVLWAFSEEVISMLADLERKRIFNNDTNNKNNKIIDMIWDDFLRNNLLYFNPKLNAKNL